MLPPAQPAYILRGHNSQIHATQFIRVNSRLVTGDAEGWIVVWDLATKRPAAVWKAHEGGPILGISAWGPGKLITCVGLNSLSSPSFPSLLSWLIHFLFGSFFFFFIYIFFFLLFFLLGLGSISSERVSSIIHPDMHVKLSRPVHDAQARF
jgi:hypothetical protein